MLAMREATAEIHVSLERRLKITLPHADERASKQTYITYVSALWGWLSPLEAALWDAGWPEHLDVARRAQKRSWLEHDLRLAGIGNAELATIPVCRPSPAFETMAERCGWAYVIEGAQLGGQVLKKKLGPALQPWEPRWLAGYGADTAQQWKTFAAYINSLSDPSMTAPASQAACAAFSSLASWFERNGACVDDCTYPI